MARPRKPHEADCMCERCEDDAVAALRAEWADRRASAQRVELAREAIAALEPAELDAVAGEMAESFKAARAQVKSSLALPAPRVERAAVIDVEPEADGDDVLVGWPAIRAALGTGIGDTVARAWFRQEEDPLPITPARGRRPPQASRADLAAWLWRNAEAIAALPRCRTCKRVGHRTGSQECPGPDAGGDAAEEDEPAPAAVARAPEPEPPSSDVFELLAEMRADGSLDESPPGPLERAGEAEMLAEPVADPRPAGAPKVGARVRWFSHARDRRVEGRVVKYVGAVAIAAIGELGIEEAVAPADMQVVVSRRMHRTTGSGTERRTTRGSMARAQSVAGPITLQERAEIDRDVAGYDGSDRPITRGDCRGGPRPCPWVSCKYNLYLDVNDATGTIKINFPDREPWEMDQSCALDVADLGGVALEDVGEVVNITRERMRQIEVKALIRIKTRMSADRDQIDVEDAAVMEDLLVGWPKIVTVVGRDEFWCRSHMRDPDPLPVTTHGNGRPPRAVTAELRAWCDRNRHKFTVEQCSACGEYGHRSNNQACRVRAVARAGAN